MKIRLRTSGGIGGFVQIPPGELDTAELDPDLARRAEELLSAESLTRAEMPENVLMTDAQEFELAVLSQEGEEVRRHRLSDAVTSPEVMQLLHDLLHEINRRRLEESRERKPSD